MLTPSNDTPSSELASAVRVALLGMMNDEAFIRHLAEEIADRLEGFDDKRIGELLAKAEDSPLADEAAVFKALRKD